VTFATITLTGKFQDVAQNWLGGTITIVPNFSEAIDAAASEIFAAIPQSYAIHPSSAGFTTAALVTTDSTDLVPGGWQYDVTVSLTGMPPWSFALALPSSLGATIDLSQLNPAVPAAPSAQFTGVIDWAGVVSYGADPTGTNDSTAAFASALSSGRAVYVAAGTFLLDSAALAYAVNGQRIIGSGEGLTTLVVGASFSGAQVIGCTALNDCGIEDLTIRSATGAWSTAPAVNAVEVAHSQRFRMRNVRGFALGGWLAEIVSDATGDSYYPLLDHVTASFCKAGVHLKGSASSDNLIAAFLSDCTFEECEDGDSLFVEDVVDLTCVNLECSPAASPSGGGTPGISLHIKGVCTSHFYANSDLGGLVSGAVNTQPALLLEANSGGGAPSAIYMVNGTAEFGTPGVKVTAGSLSINGVHISQNGTYGAEFTGTGTVGIINLFGCTFDGNNYGGGASAYDLTWQATGTGSKIECQNSIFNTPTGSSAGEVAAACAVGSGTGTSEFFGNRFNAADAFVTAGGFPNLARSNPGYNPVGPITSPPGVPLSTVEQSNFEGADMTVVVTANASETCEVQINGHTVCTIPAGGILAVPLAYSLGITLVYTGTAPTWAWYGS
jgi:Pectate lyase superfamily protein